MESVVYLDEGVDAAACRRVIRRLRERGGVRTVRRDFFLTSDWEKGTELLVFPGGADVPYDRALRGEANRRIRRFVEAGGHYFGICAGAYYGAARIEFEKGSTYEVCEARELAFFPGCAYGPVYEQGVFRYGSDAGSRIAQVAWEQGVTPVYFNGGCYFEAREGVEVLARYDDYVGRPPAVVRCKVGRGEAVLCGVHPEYPIDDPSHAAFWDFLLSCS